MFCNDDENRVRLIKLWDLTQSDAKPIVVWIGAGTSAWLGYERWESVAERFHSEFVRKCSTYGREAASHALQNKDFPKLFQACFDADPEMYRGLLKSSFLPQTVKPVYRRFLDAISRLSKASLVTTNVDEMLERHLPHFELVQTSDLARVVDLLGSPTQFIAKLHGSISAIDTAIFKTSDYENIGRPALDALETIFRTCSVLFLGYGLRDKYVLDILSDCHASNFLFGGGPHFVISPVRRPDISNLVNVIQYDSSIHTDHRSCLSALEMIALQAGPFSEPVLRRREDPTALFESAHLISDCYPAGTWTTSNTLSLVQQDKSKSGLAIVGPGWEQGELLPYSTCAHDLAVGLVSFDRIYVPLECAGRLFDLVGEGRFEKLLDDQILKFLHSEGHDMAFLDSKDSGYGCLVTGRRNAGEAMEVVSRQFRAATGKESQAAKFLAKIESSATIVDLSERGNFADVCSGLFVSPAVRTWLGIGLGTPAGRIPRWAIPPALRLVQIARLGLICERLRFGSLKLMPGAARIAEIAFSAMTGRMSASAHAAYALTGDFGIIAEASFSANPKIWDAILRFRTRPEGLSLRREILRNMSTNDGAEIIPSLDASLRELLPLDVLNTARREMSALLIANDVDQLAPAIWSDAELLSEGPKLWRRNTLKRFLTFLTAQGKTQYDLCPCGSYEKARFCCLDALRTST